MRGLARRPALSPGWSLALLIAATAMVRLWAAGAIHLTEDEAYYRLWATRLHAGYYDHPPMIAWWIRAGQTLFGDTALGVRLLPVLGTAVTTWLVFDTAQTFGLTARDGWRAALFYNCSFTVGAGAILASPDAPASLFWAASVWALARAVRAQAGGGRGVGWWLAAGVFAGLGVLSKYSALFLGPGVLLWLLSDRAGRARLSTAGPWLAAAAAVLVLSPNVIWNAQHGWMTVAKQFGRIAPAGFEPQHAPEFLAVQALLLNPLLAALAVCGVADVLAGRSRLDVGEGRGGRMIVWIGAPFLAYLLVHALHASVQAHWPAPLYSGLALLAMAGAAARPSPGWTRAARWAPVGLALSGLALAHLALPRTDIGRFDPTLPLRGWPGLTGQAQARAAKAGAAWIGTVSYGTAAQLMAEHSAAPVIQLNERRRFDGLALGPAPDTTQPGLVFDVARRVEERDLHRCFADVREVEALERGPHNGPAVIYRAFRVARPRVDVLRDGCVTDKDLRRG